MNIYFLLAKGKLETKVKGDYEGDLALIKEAVNETIDSLSAYISDITHVLSDMADGNFDIKANGRYRGAFAPNKRIFESYTFCTSRKSSEPLLYKRSEFSFVCSNVI